MTIMDWLENAEYNLGSPYPNSKLMASEQLRNAIFLLAQGYSVDTNVDQLISKYGSIDSIPPRDEADMTTISDWLDDAQRNFYSQDATSKLFALRQYVFANNLLGKGYALDTNVDELLASRELKRGLLKPSSASLNQSEIVVMSNSSRGGIESTLPYLLMSSSTLV